MVNTNLTSKGKIKIIAYILILTLFIVTAAGYVLYGESTVPAYNSVTEVTSEDFEYTEYDADYFTRTLYNDIDPDKIETAYIKHVENIARLAQIKPNESGKIMIHMFHNFITEYKGGDKKITITLDDFRNFLEVLYENDYRLISMNDYMTNNISLPKGYIPALFTFDDGWSSQFNLINVNGEYVANPDSAVGVMEEFNKKHPDFPLRGIFYINLGTSTFKGEGTLQERLSYLIGKGFEVGNHTLTHKNLSKVSNKNTLLTEVGGNAKKLAEILPGNTFTSFALPYGGQNQKLNDLIMEGAFENISYKHLNIMLAWGGPASPVSNKDYDPYKVRRIQAPGIADTYMDSLWWIENLPVEEQYLSDGDPDTITIPIDKQPLVDESILLKTNKQLIVYE